MACSHTKNEFSGATAGAVADNNKGNSWFSRFAIVDYHNKRTIIVHRRSHSKFAWGRRERSRNRKSPSWTDREILVEESLRLRFVI